MCGKGREMSLLHGFKQRTIPNAFSKTHWGFCAFYYSSLTMGRIMGLRRVALNR